MGGIWSFFYPKEDTISRQIQQQLVVKEIEAIETCVYCYIDERLKTLLIPYATKSYPWDIQCEILPHFREKTDSPPRTCYHCLQGQLRDNFSCQIIDKIFQKNTKPCQCEILSAEDSETSFENYFLCRMTKIKSLDLDMGIYKGDLRKPNWITRFKNTDLVKWVIP